MLKICLKRINPGITGILIYISLKKLSLDVVVLS